VPQARQARALLLCHSAWRSAERALVKSGFPRLPLPLPFPLQPCHFHPSSSTTIFYRRTIPFHRQQLHYLSRFYCQDVAISDVSHTTALSRIAKQASLSLRRIGELQDDRAELCRWSLTLAVCAITVSCFIHSIVALRRPSTLFGEESKEKSEGQYWDA
jgi:hypothetical protein